MRNLCLKGQYAKCTGLNLSGDLRSSTNLCPLRPRRPDAAVMVAARDDAYVSVESVEAVHRYWAGSEMRMVPGGHVSGFLMQQPAFRKAVADSLKRL